MVARATASGPPKPKHTWWALDSKVYEVENKGLRQALAKYAKRRGDIYCIVRQAPEYSVFTDQSIISSCGSQTLNACVSKL